MKRYLKKVLILIIFALMICLLKSNVSFGYFANNKEAFDALKKYEFKSENSMYTGEKLYAMGSGVMRWFLRPEITIENNDVLNLDNDIITAKKVGSSKVKLSVECNGETLYKEYNINVKELKSNNDKLDSNVNDVVAITGDTDAVTKIQLANSELWSTDKATFKVKKKKAGNVAKFVYSSVYQNRYDAIDSNRVAQIFKKDGSLTIKNTSFKKEKNVKAKDVSEWGYISNKGKYFEYEIGKDKKLSTVKIFEGVNKFLSNTVLVGNNKTYSRMGVKICDFEAVATDDMNANYYGLLLDKKGNLYYYEAKLENGKEYYQAGPNDKVTYKVKKIKSKVEAILNGLTYKTKSGKVEQAKTGNKWLDSDDEIINKKILWLTAGNRVELKNNNAYLNDKKILSKVESISNADGTDLKSALLVRKDGSIWRLDLGGKAKLSKIRSGKMSQKKISKPTKVKAKKQGKNKAKVTWKKVEGATGYTVYVSNSKNGKYKKVGTSNGTSFKAKGLKKGKYYYKVVANYSDSQFDSVKSAASNKLKI